MARRALFPSFFFQIKFLNHLFLVGFSFVLELPLFAEHARNGVALFGNSACNHHFLFIFSHGYILCWFVNADKGLSLRGSFCCYRCLLDFANVVSVFCLRVWDKSQNVLKIIMRQSMTHTKHTGIRGKINKLCLPF